jgi:hypothetical protein
MSLSSEVSLTLSAGYKTPRFQSAETLRQSLKATEPRYGKPLHNKVLNLFQVVKKIPHRER